MKSDPGPGEMAPTDRAVVPQPPREIVAAEDPRTPRDGELLEDFIAGAGEAPFAALVRRHGAMVMSVCRGVLHDRQDAEDAFQATFLVLARRAASVRKKESLGSWLHGVAYRVARAAQRRSRRQRAREKEAREQRTMAALNDLTWRETQAILHEEMERLPEKYRGPLLLCYWEGMTRDEAAEQLGWTRGTFKERLERARALLKSRLTRRGLGSLALFLAADLATSTAEAAVPVSLSDATVQAAVAPAANGSAAGALTEQALRGMAAAKWRAWVALALGVAVVAVGLTLLIREAVARRGPANGPASPAIHQPPIGQAPDGDRANKGPPGLVSGDPAWAVGAWNYKVDNYRVDLTIARDELGAWSVRGEYFDAKSGKAAGSFEGRDVRPDGAKLRFTIHYIRKPRPTYLGGTVVIDRRIDGTAFMTVLTPARDVIREMTPRPE